MWRDAPGLGKMPGQQQCGVMPLALCDYHEMASVAQCPWDFLVKHQMPAAQNLNFRKLRNSFFPPVLCRWLSLWPFCLGGKGLQWTCEQSGIELFVVALLLGLAWEKKENLPGQRSYPGREGSPQEWGGAPRARR